MELIMISKTMRNIANRLVLVTMLLVSCTREDFVVPQVKITEKTLYAFCDVDTKTSIQENGNILWNDGDQITLFYGDSSKSVFTSTNTDLAANVEFRGTLNVAEQGHIKEYCALYPHRESNSIDRSFKHIGRYTLGYYLPNKQTAIPDGFEDDLFVSYAYSTSDTLYFKNLCGGIKFSVTNDEVIKVLFSSNSSVPGLSGPVKATISNGSISLIEAQEISQPLWQTSVELAAPAGESLKRGHWYYIVTAPAILQSGYTLTFVKSDGTTAAKYYDQPVEIKRSIWGELENADAGLTYYSSPAIKAYPNPTGIRVELDWNDDYVSGSYYYFNKSNPGDTNGFGFNATDGLRRHRCIFKDLIENTEYGVYVRATYKDGHSVVSDTVYVNTGDIPESTDFSRDGEVIQLQKAEKGPGLDIAVMGDGFVDTMIEDGSYDTIMREAIEIFFSAEPYKSFREYFNVYEIIAVSKQGYFEYGKAGDTAFRSYPYSKSSSHIEADEGFAYTYTTKAFEGHKMLSIVVMNWGENGGTTRIGFPGGSNVYNPAYMNQYFSAAYCPLSFDLKNWRHVIIHEAGGHGFACLGDEYWYDDNRRLNADADYFDTWFHSKGMYKNLDDHMESDKVCWSKFIGDELYPEVGVYEGGYLYGKGVYRSTETSVMRSLNTLEFNAPSRYYIWSWIQTLISGDFDGTNYRDGDYNAFVEYDAINR